MVDWKGYLSCGQKDTDMSCGQLLLSNLSLTWTGSIFAVVFTAYWLTLVATFASDLVWMWQTKIYYSKHLNMDDACLAEDMCTWPDVVELILQEQEKRGNTTFSPHELMQRIMRHDNYLIALYNNEEFFDCTIPKTSFSMLSLSLEFCLKRCVQFAVLSHMGEPTVIDYQNKCSKNTRVLQLQRIFKFAAVLHVLVTPFLLLYLLIVKLFLGQIAQFYYRPAEMATQDWSRLALWRIRHYNEPWHIFQNRISRAKDVAQRYADRYPGAVAYVWAKFCSAIFGAMLSVFLLIGILDDSLLIQTHFLGRNLVWYIGMLVAGITLCRAWNKSPVPVVPETPEQLFQKLCEITHYTPQHWRQMLQFYDSMIASSETKDVIFVKRASLQLHREVMQLFRYKILVFWEEFLSIFFTPFFLWFHLPGRAYRIVHFIDANTVWQNGQFMCSFAMFDFDRNGNSKYAAENSQVPEKDVRDRHGKMAKSYLEFSSQFPKWHGTTTGKKFVENASQHQEKFKSMLGAAPLSFSTNLLATPLDDLLV
jgi:autophagy-related protein 9